MREVWIAQKVKSFLISASLRSPIPAWRGPPPLADSVRVAVADHLQVEVVGRLADQ
jgi:hypothetical protein